MLSSKYQAPCQGTVPETQVLFRAEKELLEALDTILSADGFKTRNEWFRAQIRRALDETTRRRVAGLLERLTVEGVRDEDIVDMVREWRSKKARHRTSSSTRT